ncbi:MFS transporter [Streptomyces asiaticus]|uniref:MFS transporter n=1 Tax=Streptomyces asiaticus TaxID=114695 RepID=UPI003D7312E6
MTRVHAHDELIPPSRRQARAVLLLGTLIFFAFGYSFLSLPAVAPSLLNYPPWHVTPSTLGILASATALGQVIGAFMGSGLSDIYGRRACIAVSVGWCSGCMLFTGLASSLIAFGVGRFLLGIGLGILLPLVSTLVVDWSRLGRRSLYCGVALSAIQLGGLAAISASHIFLAGREFHWVFLVGVLPILLVPVCLTLIPVAEPSEASLPDRATRRNSHVVSSEWWGLFEPGWLASSILFCIASFVGLLLIFGASSWLPTLMVHAGYDQHSTFEFVLAFYFGAAGITLIFSMIADWVPIKLCVFTLFLCAAVAMRTLTMHEGYLAMVGTVALCGGGVVGAQSVIISYVARYYPYQMRNTALSFVVGIGYCGSIIGPTYLSFLDGLKSDPAAGFSSFVALAMVGAVAIFLIPRGRSERSLTD